MNLQELGVPETYTFQSIILNLKAIKTNYTGILSSFLVFDIHSKLLCLRQIHDQFYSLNLETWKIDRIWEYLNNDLDYETIFHIANRQKQK